MAIYVPADIPRDQIMRIAIDAHTVGTQLAGNVTFITNTIEALAQIDQKNQYTLYIAEPDAVERYKNRWDNFTIRRINRNTPIIKKLFSYNAQLRLHPADIFFAQFNSPRSSPCRVVIMIPDLSFEHLPETLTPANRRRMRLTVSRTAKRAAHIITPSEYSRQDLIETYQIPPEKISMIPHAASEIFKPITDPGEMSRVRQKYDLHGDFILGVGSIQPRKNLVRLIEAYSILVKKREDIPPLVLVGKKAWLFEDTINATKTFDVEDRVFFTNFVPDEDLPALYSAATCFVFPSYFEGFGLPPLEAMQCGTPVIAGDRTSIPEVVGDAGLLVDPFDINALASALERMITDENLRASLFRKGIERAKKFTWIGAARQTLEIFEKVAAT